MDGELLNNLFNRILCTSSQISHGLTLPSCAHLHGSRLGDAGVLCCGSTFFYQLLLITPKETSSRGVLI